MNTFGFDYQQTLSVICLRESQGVDARFRIITDGSHKLIPNAVKGKEFWGSQALLSSGPEVLCKGDPYASGPWLEEPGCRSLWANIYARLKSYLGRVAPSHQNGYQTVVALQAIDYAVSAGKISTMCCEMGWDEVICICGTDALLSAWIAEDKSLQIGEHVIAVVACGDSITDVSAYRVSRSQGCPPKIESAYRLGTAIEAGNAKWANRVVSLVRNRFIVPPDQLPQSHSLRLRDGALSFAARLAKSGPLEAVKWNAPFRDQMYMDLRLTVEDCQAWPEVITLEQDLAHSVRNAVGHLSERRNPDLIVLGGVGAIWPFARIALTGVSPIWQSGHPEEDVARGAAYWPIVAKEALTEIDTQFQTKRAPVASDIEDNKKNQMLSADIDIRPPWLRDD